MGHCARRAVIELKLRPGVKWHDGKDFTAQDYLTMYAYLSDPALEGDIGVSKIKALLTPVTAIEAPDATTLVMRFAAPLPYVTDILDYFYAIRIDDTSDPQFLSNLPVGTGPFKMTEYIGGQGATFEANPDYHLPDRPLLDGFSIAVYGGGGNLAPNLLSGTVDGVLLANQAEAETSRTTPTTTSRSTRPASSESGGQLREGALRQEGGSPGAVVLDKSPGHGGCRPLRSRAARLLAILQPRGNGLS